MTNYEVIIKPTAERDLERRFFQIRQHSPLNAARWYQSMNAAINSLQQLPERCAVAPESTDLNFQVRHLIIGDYRILFTVTNTVSILNIRHSRHARVL